MPWLRMLVKDDPKRTARRASSEKVRKPSPEGGWTKPIAPEGGWNKP